MTTPRKDTALARRRREVATLRDAAAPTTGLAFVQPPIAQVLGSIQAVAANEVQAMLQDQKDPNRRLNNDDAKKLATLTDALVKAHGAEAGLSEEELGKLSDEDLEQELLAELERVRARRAP